jgi:hypothetical protein
MAVTLDVEVGENKSGEQATVKTETMGTKVCFWASNFVGLLCGLLYAFAGFAKVTGGMDGMIAGTLAPFYGVPPVLFKVLAFFGHFTGGVCMIGGLYVKMCMKLKKIPADIGGKSADTLETLILMDGVGMITIALGALLKHAICGEPLFTPLVIAFLFLPLRFGSNDWTIPRGMYPLTNRRLFFGFLAVNVLGFIISVVMHFTIGECKEFQM